ncbi:unnamed protein product [Phyllotreta striolata]|uniref:UBX domain-containing protein 4 n=1 Tax=Phyllotreta striolata TaxID=444603 RepID=A0A9N9TUJ8_PHYSR|nr:unnamed protein product [Phyllotreta striolata]
MKWYSGGIAEAITHSKSIGAVFVVYIEGTDETSKKITDLIDNGELGRKLEQDCFVAVKLQGGSVEHLQFSEIYKEPSIPSVYFIGKNGVPIEIITSKDKVENICKKIDDSLSIAGINLQSTNATSASVASENFIKSETGASGSSKVVCDGDVCKIVENNSPNVETGEDSLNREQENIQQQQQQHSSNKEETNTPEDDKSNELSVEEKVERAKELLELKRQQKEQEEKEKERQKEIDRRKMGQNAQQLKKWQEDQELKQMMEEREREKRENKQARDRVLAQIAQDRAERQSRSQIQPQPAAEPAKPVSQSPPKPPSNITRLQFKLPDGSSTTHEFQNSDTLETVVFYIKTSLQLPFSEFTLSTMFPRREFTDNDHSQTLVDLQLSPTAVVLVLPHSGPVVPNSNGFLTSLMYGLLAPILGIFNYLRSLMFGQPVAAQPQKAQKRPPPDEPMESRRFPQSKKKSSDGSSVVRRQGNIHRLSDATDSEDENNTWNGNSTQQM